MAADPWPAEMVARRRGLPLDWLLETENARPVTLGDDTTALERAQA